MWLCGFRDPSPVKGRAILVPGSVRESASEEKDRARRAGHTTQRTLLELETERGGQDTQHNVHCWN